MMSFMGCCLGGWGCGDGMACHGEGGVMLASVISLAGDTNSSSSLIPCAYIFIFYLSYICPPPQGKSLVIISEAIHKLF